MGATIWALAAEQHGVITRSQLLRLGVSVQAIKHRIGTRRLHPIGRGVYAVGRPELTRRGRWMAAVLSCGPDACLSHTSAAALWGVRSARDLQVEISVPAPRAPRRRGIRVHRRAALAADDRATCDRIPVTSPTRTLVDLALRLPAGRLEAAISEADKRDLVDPEALRQALDGLVGQPGVGRLRRVLDHRTFSLTDSELERRFLPIARRAGLARPRTRARVNDFRVDFYWPCLNLVVETDGLRYHRTPAQQARDRIRDQAHTAAGLTALRFTHAQIRYEPEHVETTLAAVVGRLASRARGS